MNMDGNQGSDSSYVRALEGAHAADTARLQAVVALHRDLGSAEFEMDNIMEWLVTRSRVLFGLHQASFGLIEGGDIVYTVVTRANRTVGERNPTPLANSISGICVRTGETMVCTDSESDPRADRDACRRAGLRSMVLVPIRHSGRFVGVLNVNSPEPGAFRDADIRTVELVGGVVSAAYSHAADLAAKRELLNRLNLTVAALEQSQAKLAHDVLHDELTQLPNRMHFMERLRFAVGRTERHGGMVAALFVDVDHFKSVNDTHGHDVGDIVLKEVAARLATCVRTGDTPARFGGDEFTVLCEDLTDTDQALEVADRILGRLREPLAVAGRTLSATVSIGVAVSSRGDLQAEDLLKNADVALYRAKESGRDQVTLFREDPVGTSAG